MLSGIFAKGFDLLGGERPIIWRIGRQNSFRKF